MTPAPSAPQRIDRHARGDEPAGGALSLGLLLAAALFWSGSIVLGRAVSGEIPPLGLAFWRWLLATVALLPIAAERLRHDWPVIRRHLPLFVLLAFLGVATSNSLLYAGLRHTTSINAVLLQSLLPAVVFALTSLSRRDPVRWGPLGGLAIAFSGTLLIVFEGRPARLAELQLNTGDLLVLGGVAAYAAYTVLLRGRPAVHPLSFLLTICLLGVPILLPFYLLESALVAPVPISGASIASFLYLGLGPSLLAYLFYDRGVRVLGARSASLVFYLTPVLGAGMSVLLLGETLHGFHAAGAALIALGVWRATRSPAAAARRTTADRHAPGSVPVTERTAVRPLGDAR